MRFVSYLWATKDGFDEWAVKGCFTVRYTKRNYDLGMLPNFTSQVSYSLTFLGTYMLQSYIGFELVLIRILGTVVWKQY